MAVLELSVEVPLELGSMLIHQVSEFKAKLTPLASDHAPARTKMVAKLRPRLVSRSTTGRGETFPSDVDCAGIIDDEHLVLGHDPDYITHRVDVVKLRAVLFRPAKSRCCRPHSI